MEFLNSIINTEKKVCFFCFTKCENLESIWKELHIYDEYSNTTSSVYNMMTYLFPSQEILFHDVCMACSSKILSMYLMLRRYDAKKIMYSIIMDKLINVVNKDIPTQKPFKLYVKLPMMIDKGSKDSETNLMVHESNSEELCEKIEKRYIKNEAKVCDVCGKVCKTPNALKAHLNCHKEKSCPYCSKILKTHSHFNLHVKRHKGIRKIHRRTENFYYCNDCEYRSLNKSSLEAHINKYHLRERPFTCQICTKGFYKKSNLTEHVLTHRSVKNLTCEQCGESFVHKKTLAEHLRLHSGEKPYNCNVCKAKFVTAGRRSDHFKRKHGDKNECCNICSKKFSLKKDLNRHMKIVHERSADCSKMQLLQTNYEFLDENGDVLPVLSSI